MENQIKAVIYARYSSAQQREESIEGQVRTCEEYARKHNLKILATYADRAISGRTDARPEFQKLIRDSARKKFEVVLVWKLDRFARNRYDSAVYKLKLKQNGVRIQSVEENIPEGAEGIILESVMEGFAEYYSANLSENVKRGLEENALKRYKTATVILGYKRGEDNRYSIVESEAYIVRRIFNEYIAGEPSYKIIERLNAEGFRTARNQPFTKNSVRTIIENEKYKGVYRYKDLVYDPQGIPPIVDVETWEKAQTCRHIRAKAPAQKRTGTTGWLLSGKIYCGECGERLQCESGTSNSGKVYEYYTCVGRKEHACTKKRVRKEEAENYVVDKLMQLVHSDEAIEAIADACVDYQKQEHSSGEIPVFEQRLKEIAKSRKNLIQMCEDGFGTAEVAERLNALRAEEANINEQLEKLKYQEPYIPKELVVDFLSQLKQGERTSAEYRLLLVDTFLCKVWFFDDRNPIIQLNYSPDNNDKFDIFKFLNDEESSQLECSFQLRHFKTNILFAEFALLCV